MDLTSQSSIFVVGLLLFFLPASLGEQSPRVWLLSSLLLECEAAVSPSFCHFAIAMDTVGALWGVTRNYWG